MNFLFTIVYLRWSHENGPLENDEGRKSNCVVWLATNGVEHRPGRRVSSSSLSYFPVCMTFCSSCYVLIIRNHILKDGQLHFQFFFVLLKSRKLILRHLFFSKYKLSLNPWKQCTDIHRQAPSVGAKVDFVCSGDGRGCHSRGTDKDHWFDMSIRDLTWATVATKLATLPPILG